MMNIRFLEECYETAADCSSAEEHQPVLTFLCSTLPRLLSIPISVMNLDNFEVMYVVEACRPALIIHDFGVVERASTGFSIDG